MIKNKKEKLLITDIAEGDIVRLKIFNSKNKKEWSLYRITITENAYKGDGIDEDVMLEETTGYEED